MRSQELWDVAVAVTIGIVVAICLAAFGLQIPALGLDGTYLSGQVVGFGMLIGVLPIIGYNGKTAQVIMVSICLTATGVVLLGILLVSSISPELKVLTLAALAVSAAGAEYSYRATVPDDSILFVAVLVSAWVFAFSLIVFFGLLSASIIPTFTWVGVIVAVAVFAVLFDSLSREISESRSP